MGTARKTRGASPNASGIDKDVALKALRTVTAVAKIIGESTEATCSLREALGLITEMCQAETAAVFAAWPDGSVEPLIWYSPSFAWDRTPFDFRSLISAQTMATGLPAVVEAEKVWLAAVPIHSRSRAVGVLVVEALSPVGFGEIQMGALEAVAIQIGLALENSLMYDRINEHNYGFRAVMESLREGFILIEDDHVVYCNSRAAVQLEMKREDLVDSEVAVLHGRLGQMSAKPGEVLEFLAEQTTGAERWSVTFPLVGAEKRHYRLYGFPIQGPTGEPLGHAYFLRDVSEEVELDQMKSDILSFVSHELATPITTIKGVLSSLDRRDVVWSKSQRDQLLQDIREETERLQRLVETIMETSRLESGLFRADVSLVRVGNLVERCVTAARRRAPEADIDTERPDDDLSWPLDPRGIERVLSNLIDNAVKYTVDRPQVRVSVTRDGDAILFEVADRGIGIEPSERERVFQKFYRSRSLRVQHETGSGLGLALAEGIVRAHDGTLWVDGREGGGSVFRFRIPRLSLEDEEATAIL